MYRIKTLNKISPAGLSVLDQTRYTISTDVENEDGILVRSADMHDYAFPDALRAVARAGAGTNNIPRNSSDHRYAGCTSFHHDRKQR